MAFNYRDPSTFDPGQFYPEEPPPLTYEDILAAYQRAYQPPAPQGFLDRFTAGLQNMPLLPIPRGGAGFVSGLARGFSGAYQSARGRGEQARAEQNRLNLEATTEALRQESQHRAGVGAPAKAYAMAKATAQGHAAGTPPPPATSSNVTLEEVKAANDAGIPVPQSAVGQPRANYPQLAKAFPKSSSGIMASGEELTPEAITIYANERAATGQNKGLSVRDVKTIRAVSNEMARLYPGINLARNAAVFNANRGSLANMTKLHDGVAAFASTADKNVQVLDEYAVKIGGYDSPMVNKTLRWFEANMKGSPELFAYNAARETVKNEYTRILNTLAGSGQITDTARKEMDAFIRGDLGLKAMREVLDVLRRDAINRDSAYTDAIAEITQRFGNPYGGQNNNVPPGFRPH